MYFDGMEARHRLNKEPLPPVMIDWLWIAALVGSMLAVGAWSWMK